MKNAKYEANRQKKEITEIFESFEYMLRERLEQADQILARIDYEGACFGVTETFRREYVRDRLIGMIKDIADKREGRSNAM